MSLFLTQLMNGIGSGAVYASLALALVLVFRTTGILNFAQGEMALYSTYLVWYFTQHDMPVWIAILLSMAISFIGGAAIERVLIRPVEQASPLVLVIVTIGMFLAINSIAQVQFGNDIKLLPRAYVMVHFDMLNTYVPGLRDLLLQMRPKDTIAVGIDENTALYGDGERWHVSGSGSVWIGADGNELAPHGDGETLDLRLL